MTTIINDKEGYQKEREMASFLGLFNHTKSALTTAPSSEKGFFKTLNQEVHGFYSALDTSIQQNDYPAFLKAVAELILKARNLSSETHHALTNPQDLSYEQTMLSKKLSEVLTKYSDMTEQNKQAILELWIKGSSQQEESAGIVAKIERWLPYDLFEKEHSLVLANQQTPETSDPTIRDSFHPMAGGG